MALACLAVGALVGCTRKTREIGRSSSVSLRDGMVSAPVGPSAVAKGPADGFVSGPAVDGSEAASSDEATDGDLRLEDAAEPPPPAVTLADLSGPGSCTEQFHRDSIPETAARRIVLNELRLLWMALDVLEEKEWNGAWGEPLPIAAKDFDAREVRRMVSDEARKDGELTIPAEWESLYVSDEAAKEVQAGILRAREEFSAFLGERDVHPGYLAELDRVLPGTAERMRYFADNDPDADPTATSPLVVDESTMEQDDSRLQLEVHGADIWNGSDLCRDAKLLGDEPAGDEARREWHRGCRDVSLRQTVYHELTHALQKAYVNLHLPPAGRDARAAWSDAVRSLSDLERSYFWRWGGHEALAAVANHHLAQERQADGVSFEVLVVACGLSEAQALAIWEHWFGRLSDARDLLLRIRDRFERTWPDYPADDFGGALVDVLGSGWTGKVGELRSLALKLGGLPAYAGYLQPTRPGESAGFWGALREAPLFGPSGS